VRHKGQQLQIGNQEVAYKHKEKLIYFEVTEHWHRLPIEAVTSSLEILKTHLDAFLCNLL